MHLLLIRHGETEHNVAGLLAGVTDSRLTNHGVLQAQRLGSYLAGSRQLQLTQIYASDLQRAWMTAGEIHKAQSEAWNASRLNGEVITLPLLREQDFGSFELVPWTSKRADDAFTTKVPSATDPDFKPRETAEQMKERADHFLDDFIVPMLALDSEESVAIVSHGLFLSALWRALLSRFDTSEVSLGPDVAPPAPGRPLEYIGSWSNTGYLELTVQPSSASQGDHDPAAEHTTRLRGSLKILAINRRDHLENLKRTRGIGSGAFDSRQKQIDTFFKRPQT
jgi:broad specificity phosphatase PhoE